MTRVKTHDANPSKKISAAAGAINVGAAVLRVTAEQLEGHDDQTADRLWSIARSAKRLENTLERLAVEKAEQS
jgi:hypothetical protein